MELKLYELTDGEPLAVLYHDTGQIGFYLYTENGDNAFPYKIQNSDIDFIKENYTIIPWENKYNREMIEIFFRFREKFIQWL